MAARAKYLFDHDFAAGSGGAEKAVAPSEHAILLGEAESKGFRDGFAAAEKEGTAVAARRAAVAAFSRDRSGAAKSVSNRNFAGAAINTPARRRHGSWSA